MSFRRRLALLAAVAVAVAVAGASGLVYLVARDELRGQVDEQLRGVAAQAVTLPVPPPEAAAPTRDRLFTRRVTLAVPADPLGAPVGYAQLVDTRGSVVPARGLRPVLTMTREDHDVARGRRAPFFSDRDVNGVHARVFTTRAGPGRALQAVQPLDDVDATLQRLGLALIAVSLGGVLLAAALGLIVARAALGPVTRLSGAAAEVARTRDLGRRMEVTGRDEVSRLAESFNAMLDALAEAQAGQRRLVADASHELRTPLTSLRTNIEVLGRGEALPAADRERLRDDVVAQLEELGALVGDLVDLARGDEPAGDFEEVRLDLLARDAVERARRHAPDVRFALDTRPTLVRAVPARLHRALSNLLDNAAKFSPAGAAVDVRVRPGEVTVRDRGPGIAAADRTLVFERFYRAPAARGRPGSGLGLAIVRQVAEAHGGRVEALPAEGGGALLRLTVPASHELPNGGSDASQAGGLDSRHANSTGTPSPRRRGPRRRVRLLRRRQPRVGR